MRWGPGTDYKVDGLFIKGETVYILEEKAGWFRVRRAHGQEDWVSADFLKKE